MDSVIGNVLQRARRLWERRQAWLNRPRECVPYAGPR